MKYEKQLQAKQLRMQGKSINYIAKILQVSASSVSMWVRDITLTEEQQQKLLDHKSYNFKFGVNDKKKKDALELRKMYQEEGRKQARQNDLLHCMGCMLFWAEGSKNKNVIAFTNSDSYMLKLFVQFLKQSCKLSNSDISMRINCFLHKEEDITATTNYWIKELDIDGCSIQKPTIKITSEDISNNGVCSLTVFNTKLAQQLYGAIQEYGNFNNEMCLNNKRTRKLNKKI